MNRVLFAPRSLPPLPPDVAQDPSAYDPWVRAREQGRTRKAPRRPTPLDLVAIVVGPAPPTSARTLAALARQTSRDWTLTIVTTDHEFEAVRLLVRDTLGRRWARRVRTSSVPEGTPIPTMLREALAGTEGAGVALIALGDVWASDAVALLGAQLQPDTLVYADEDLLGEDGHHVEPRLKPGYSPDFLLSTGYTGRPLALGREVVRALPDLTANEMESLEHDCALAASEVARRVVHIPEVLCHRTVSADYTQSGDIHVRAALARRAEPAEVTRGSLPGSFRVRRAVAPSGTVSILIPFRDQPWFLRTCVDSVSATLGGERVEFVLIDNGSTDPEMHTLLEELAERSDVMVLSDPRPFNWARLNNEGAAVARGEVLLCLNDDIEARSEGWLSLLRSHALRPDVAAVGARLLYPDRRLQHCGVVVGLGGAAGHPLVGLDEGEPGYLQMASATREVAAVTGACLATRREVFDRLGGFDETLGVDLNDIDYCLRAGAAGFRTLFEPGAELIHHESPSRGTAGGVNDIMHFVDRWADYIRAGDALYSVHLTRTDRSCALARPDEEEVWNRWYTNLTMQ